MDIAIQLKKRNLEMIDHRQHREHYPILQVEF